MKDGSADSFAFIQVHASIQERPVHRREPPGILEAKVESLEELIKAKNENITDLQNQVGFLTQDHIRISGQLDRLLMPPQEVNVKKWFQFWK